MQFRFICAAAVTADDSSVTTTAADVPAPVVPAPVTASTAV